MKPGNQRHENMKPENMKPEVLKSDGMKPKSQEPEHLQPESLKHQNLTPDNLKSDFGWRDLTIRRDFPMKSSSLQVVPLHGFTHGVVDSPLTICTSRRISGFTRSTSEAATLAKQFSRALPACKYWGFRL